MIKAILSAMKVWTEKRITELKTELNQSIKKLNDVFYKKEEFVEFLELEESHSNTDNYYAYNVGLFPETDKVISSLKNGSELMLFLAPADDPSNTPIYRYTFNNEIIINLQEIHIAINEKARFSTYNGMGGYSIDIVCSNDYSATMAIVSKSDTISGLISKANAGKMDKQDPICSGSFSMNRREDSRIGYNSHAEGYYTTASGTYSHAEGYYTTASGVDSHAEGYYTTASGSYSHTEGRYTTASGVDSHAEGRYNIDNSSYAHIVGNGAATNKRSNAHTLDWQGNAWYAGDVYVGSTSGTNRDEGSVKLAKETDLYGETFGEYINSLIEAKLEEHGLTDGGSTETKNVTVNFIDGTSAVLRVVE